MATLKSIQPQPARLAQAVRLYLNVTALLRKWYVNRATRKQLMGLPDFMLKDVGISRSQAEQEYRKPFWKS